MFPYVHTHRQAYVHVVPSVQTLAPAQSSEFWVQIITCTQTFGITHFCSRQCPRQQEVVHRKHHQLSGCNQCIPSIPAGLSQICYSELNQQEDPFFFLWWDTRSLFSEFRLIQAPGKLSNKATRSQTGRTDTGFSYASCFLSITDRDHSSPLQCAQEVYLGSAFHCPSCYTAY